MASRMTTVGKATDIKPGKLVAAKANGVQIALANVNGQYYAVDELCTHEDCSLVEEGTLDGTVITCECHGSQFDVTTGAVLAPPAFEPLKVYKVHVKDDDLIVEV